MSEGRPLAENGGLRLVTERTPALLGSAEAVTWAVAVLEDGTEIRMRHLGDRVEVRGWDPMAECRPPALRADVLGQYHHIVDVSAAASPGSLHAPNCATVLHESTRPCDCWMEADRD